MSGYFAKRVGLVRAALFLLPILLFVVTFSTLGGRAAAFPGDYFIEVKLTNTRDDVTVTASRPDAEIGKKDFTLTGTGTKYISETALHTNDTICRDTPQQCTWNIIVKDRSGVTVGSANNQRIGSANIVEGKVGNPVVTVDVLAKGAPTTAAGSASGTAQFRDYHQGNIIKNAPPASTTIAFSLNNTACAANNPTNDPGKGCYVVSPTAGSAEIACTGTGGTTAATYTIQNMKPGNYTARMSGGYSGTGASGGITFKTEKTAVINGGSNTAVDFLDAQVAAPTPAPAACTEPCADGLERSPQGDCPEDGVFLDCGNGSFNWIVCPLLTLGVKSIQIMDSFIMNTLNVDVRPIFDQTAQEGTASSGYYKAWSSFRAIAIALLVIAGLVMVISQALGFEFLDAYTIRKTLPRLLVAIIGISLSWPLMRLAVSFFDVLGVSTRELMYAPFRNFGGTLDVFTGILTTILGIGLWIAMGPAALTFLLTAAISVLVGYLILVVRQVAIIMLIIVAPIAIACYVLPNTQRVWVMWRDNFLGLMLMFPIMSAAIAAAHIFAVVAITTGNEAASLTISAMGVVAGLTGHSFSGNFVAAANNIGSLAAQGSAMVVYFGVYLSLPKIAQKSIGAIGAAAAFIDNSFAGMKTGLQKGRSNALSNRGAALKAGSLYNPDSKWTKRLGGNAINRVGSHIGAGTRGRFGFGAVGAAARANAQFASADTLSRENSAFAAQSKNEDAMVAVALGNDRTKLARLAHFRKQNTDGSYVKDAGGSYVIDEKKLNDALAKARPIRADRRTQVAAFDALAQSGKVIANRAELDYILNEVSGGNGALKGAAKGQGQYTLRSVGRADIGRDNAYESIRELDASGVSRLKPAAAAELFGTDPATGKSQFDEAIRVAEPQEREAMFIVLQAAEASPYLSPDKKASVAQTIARLEGEPDFAKARAAYNKSRGDAADSTTPKGAGGTPEVA